MNLSVMPDGSERIYYQNPEIPIYISISDLAHLSNMSALCHWHEDVELLLATRGYLNYSVNGKVIRVGEGNAIFITPRQMHYGFTADGTDCQYICVCFRPELLSSHRYLYERYIAPVCENTGLTHLLIEQGKPGHDRLLDLIRQLGTMNERDLTMVSRLFELWQGIFDLCETGSPPAADKHLDCLKQMLALISGQYAERITLAQVAAAGGVCRSKCCQIFRKYMGCTPNEYLTSFRIERATALLRESNLPITEIAHVCGFSSSSYFAESFARRKGCTPTEYRKNYR